MVRIFSYKHLSTAPQSKRATTHFLPSSLYFLHSQSSHSIDKEVETLYRIITITQTPEGLKQSLKSSQINLSNDLIDRVLKRVRFSHSNPLQALEFFKYAAKRKGFYHTGFSLDTMLYVLGRSRKFDKVWEVLVEMKRKDQSLITPRTVQVVLGRVAKVCSVRQTVESFWGFKRLVNEFGVDCFNALLRALCQEKSMTDARNVYHSLKVKFRPNNQTFNILLSGWKSSEDAEGFFKEMRDLRVEPDIVSYNCLVDVYCKGREMEKAFRVVEEMREKDITPDVITYTSLIGGLGLVGQPDKARHILKDMREYGCYPDAAAYNAAIRNFCIAKRIGDAYSLMDEMVSNGLSPNATTYNVFLRLIRRHDKVEMALELWDDMMERGFGSYILVSDVLFDLLCDLGKLAEAERCFLQMVDKGQKPSNVSFRRIKVLMELANKQEALKLLSEKMAAFGSSTQLIQEDKAEYEQSSSDFATC
ncbi:hypothetical protein HAX54_025004 [Datura stramonium]|uniref:Pentatricopeptide repeat-containing protein n=1 Tax=Datura stramonium TaxID=4076 RepID=A0ABS8UZ01_DATST|nr:hypothetical protein [Datura stramonium]